MIKKIALLFHAVCLFSLVKASIPINIPPEGVVMERSFQEQEGKIAASSFRKYSKEVKELMKECIRNENFELAKRIQDTCRSQSFSGTNHPDCVFFMGEWHEFTRNGKIFMHRFDGINGTHKTSDGLKWGHTGKINTDISSAGVLALKEDSWNRRWIKIDDNNILQVLLSVGNVSPLKRKTGGENSEMKKYIQLLKRISADFEIEKTKLSKVYAAALQKKSKSWALTNNLEAALWAQQRIKNLRNQEKLAELAGTWTFSDAVIHITKPSEFQKSSKNSTNKTTFRYVKSLNNQVHLFKVEETKQEKIVVRSGNNLLIIPPDAGGQAQIGMLKP